MTSNEENEIVEPNAGLEIDPLDNYMQEVEEPPLPQAKQVILPIMMRKGKDYVQLGDGIVDPETSAMVVSFNTKAGRDILEFIGTGALSGISFGGMMSRNSLTNKLN